MNKTGLHDIIREDYENTPHPDFESIWEHVVNEISEDPEAAV